MDFLKKIKSDMYDEMKRRGYGNQCVVDTMALRELLDNFERLDSFARLVADDCHSSLEHRLYTIIEALYAENHDSERLMVLIIDIMRPMIKQRVKEREIDRRYTHY